MKRLRAVIFAILYLSISCCIFAQTDKMKEALPDFAFPQKVIDDARLRLERADSTSSDGPARLAAVLEIIAANSAIDHSRLTEAPAIVEKQLAVAGIDNATKAMLLALEAEVYGKIYEANRYKYNNTETVDGPVPDDITEWSADNFRSRIFELLDSASAVADLTPLKKYSRAIEGSDEGYVYIPTVRDFIALKKYNSFLKFRTDTVNYATELRAVAADALSRCVEGSPTFFCWTVREALFCPNHTKRILDTYMQYKNVEAARFLLSYLTSTGNTVEAAPEADEAENLAALRRERLEMISLLEESLTLFPSWYGNNGLRNRLNSLRQPNVKTHFPSAAAPLEKITVSVQWEFARKFVLAFYPVSRRSDNINPKTLVAKGKPAASTTYATDSIFGTKEFKVTFSNPGLYAAVLTVDGEVYGRCSIIDVTTVYPVVVSGCPEGIIAVADFTTGKPVKGVAVSKNESRTITVKKSMGKTNDSGLLKYAAPQNTDWRSVWLSFKYKGKEYSFDREMWLNNYRPTDTTARQTSVLIFTDRPIYHPGDSIQWAAVAGQGNAVGDRRQPVAGKRFRASLRDVNRKLVDTLVFESDALGRFHGSFVTPKGRLTGYYTLTVQCVDDSRMASSSSIMVSDYKAPVFETAITSISRDMPSSGDVTVRGEARTYSGMPVAGAKVDLVLQAASRWRWFSPAAQIGRLDTVTDASGAFTFVLPASLLSTEVNGAPCRDFIAQATVTSATAETATASRPFTLGRPYTFIIGTSSRVDIDKPLTVTVDAVNADGDKVNVAYRWTVIEDKTCNVLLSGDATTDKPLSLDLSKVPAVDCRLKVEAVDAGLADPEASGMMALYSVARNELSPSLPKLFVPQTKIAAEDGRIEIPVGTSADALYVYAVVRCGDELVSADVKEIGAGFSTLSVGLPDGFDPSDTQVKLFAVYRGHTYTSDVEPLLPESSRPRVIAESFRDRLLPGSTETWRFRMVSGESPMADAGMIATMYDKALDAIITNRWPAGFSIYRYTRSLSLNTFNVYNFTESFSVPYRYLNEKSIQWPEFRYINDMLMTTGGVVMMKNMMYSRLEASADRSFDSSDMAVVDMDAPMSAEVTEEAEVAEAGAPEQLETEYRQGEIPVAFWRPALVADANGNIDISFTVPNANTTWKLQSFVWDKSLATASYAAEAIANKPVMVQPNLPRFLRQGDKARILATVFNSSDEDREVRTVVEIFDIATGEVLTASEHTDTLAPKASAVVGIDVEAPVTVAAVGYRVRAISENYSDGEQASIPVLESAATVIESETFYLNPSDAKPFRFTVNPPKNAAVTLRYCQNPVWTIVKAMRGISSEGSLTSNLAVSKLFSAMAARYIVANNADVAKALKEWADNPSEEAFKSMLGKDEDLKKLLLDQTPWLQAANNESARMASLAELLDAERADAAFDTSKTALTRFQMSDGGFAWGSWSKESSLWCTENVLTTLGIARSLGMLDKSFDAMLEKAFGYLQTEIAKLENHTVDTDLTLIASYFPDFKLTETGRMIVKATVDDIEAGWRKHSTVDKAYDVLILKADGRDDTARTILNSIRQFAVPSPAEGTSFPNVTDIRGYATIIQAYKAMDAPNIEIDPLRQWITVRAQALDDLGAYNPDYVIAALLMTGTEWTSVPVSEDVTVNGTPIVLNKVESMTGFFSQTLDVSGKTVVTVKPNGVTPSYGSVVTVYSKPASTVKAKGASGLSIEKQYLVETDGKWVAANTFTLGQKVRVRLTVKVRSDLEYVSIDDERAAAFEPVDQLPGFVWDASLAFYRENLDASTRLFISWLPKGTYHISYDMTAAAAGSFSSGIATLQSQYAPELTAHSAGNTITVK